jgi:hypothetical protein
MQNNDKASYVISGLVVGFLLSIYFKAYNFFSGMGQNFWEINLFEVISLVVQCLLAIYLAVYLAKKISNKSKLDDHVFDLLIDLDKKLSILMSDYTKYCHNPGGVIAAKILMNFQDCSILVSNINAVTGVIEANEMKKITTSFLAFKKSVTDSPFNTASQMGKLANLTAQTKLKSLRGVILETRLEIYRK